MGKTASFSRGRGGIDEQESQRMGFRFAGRFEQIGRVIDPNEHAALVSRRSVSLGGMFLLYWLYWA